MTKLTDRQRAFKSVKKVLIKLYPIKSNTIYLEECMYKNEDKLIIILKISFLLDVKPPPRLYVKCKYDLKNKVVKNVRKDIRK